MNDFTKEELIYIKNMGFEGSGAIRFDHHEILRDKIQSMIDNYCEHEYEGCCESCAIEECIHCKKVRWDS